MKVSPWILTGMFAQKPKDIYLHVLSSAPWSEVLGAPQRKGNEVAGGREDFTSRVPRSSKNMDDPRPFWYGGMIPPYLFHVEQSLQCLRIDLTFVISRMLQPSHDVSLEKVEGNIELLEIVFSIIRNSISNNI